MSFFFHWYIHYEFCVGSLFFFLKQQEAEALEDERRLQGFCVFFWSTFKAEQCNDLLHLVCVSGCSREYNWGVDIKRKIIKTAISLSRSHLWIPLYCFSFCLLLPSYCPETFDRNQLFHLAVEHCQNYLWLQSTL